MQTAACITVLRAGVHQVTHAAAARVACNRAYARAAIHAQAAGGAARAIDPGSVRQRQVPRSGVPVQGTRRLVQEIAYDRNMDAYLETVQHMETATN